MSRRWAWFPLAALAVVLAGCGGSGSSSSSSSNAKSGSSGPPPTSTVADLAVSITVDNATPAVGSTIHYTVTAAAQGTGASTGVVVHSLLPSNLTFVSATASMGSYAASSGVWTVGDMPANTSQTLVLAATVNSNAGAATIPNTATASESSVDVDPNQTNNSAQVTVVVAATGGPPPTTTVADLAVSMTVDNATPAVGDTIHYTITAAAQGTGASTGVVVDSLLPSNLTFVSATASMGSYAASSGVWTVGDMPANTSQTLVLAATVNNNAGAATIPNTATASESPVDVDPNQTNNSAQVDVVVGATVADLAVSMTVDNANPAVGETIRYTITAGAKGVGPSIGVVVNSLLPPSLTYVSATASMGSYVASSGVWTVGDLPANTSQTLVLAATVNNNAGAATIPNTATAGESPVDVDPDQTNNIAQADVNVAPGGSGIDNVQPIFVNAGITGNYANGVFTSVEVCVPGTTNCQTIDNVLVDTGSYGLRLLSTQTSGDGLVSLPLPQSTDGSGHAIGECTQFQDAYTWGPVATADIQIAGEKAASVPIQILGQAGFASAPSACTGSGLAENDSQSSLGANGVLGIGVFRHDCGANCTAAGNSGSIPPVYFSCPTSGCVATDVDLTQQVQNPVWLFPQDNDGVIIQLPAIPNAGAVSATGTLTFGIGTQSNNALSGTASVLAADGSTGGIKTVYQGVTYPTGTGGSTVLDTGSNGIFFLDQATLNYPACPSGDTSFYCPAATASFSVTNQSAGTGTITTALAPFSITSADILFGNSSSFNAFSQLGGPNPDTFDFGLPFFFGRTIYFGINATPRAGGLGGVTTGPFFAY